MTGLDFIAAGVAFRAGGVVEGPTGREDLLEQLRAEVARRVPRLAFDDIPTIPTSPRAGACDVCGDELPHYRGGMCELCCLARRKARGGMPAFVAAAPVAPPPAPRVSRLPRIPRAA